ncbi:MAG: helix-turn-helix domain-containing protein [Burkholderiaceae bacterium]|nr:helix-turn-helix domain-containing protein [Burkholderiaceae bacterium]
MSALPPLEYERRTVVSTAEAAIYLNRKTQTLRLWACTEEGPIRPVRVNGRLLWRVADLRQLLGIERKTDTPRVTEAA